MALKIDLRAGEKLHIGDSTLLVASNERTTVIIDGSLPVVRERDFLPEERATTWISKLYLAVQTQYLRPSGASLAEIYKIYFQGSAMPSATVIQAMRDVANGDLYKALRAIRATASDEDSAVR
jgi:flagellar protein FlbT